MQDERDVTRQGDRSEAGLRVLLDSDDDVIVELYEPGKRAISVEFCNGFNGGGRSPRTRGALIDLLRAIEEDQAARPLRTDRPAPRA